MSSVLFIYMGDKVQSILGHLQKDFEGGVSAENLGAKFGGYGSFLPTHQRSPSIWSHPKFPHKVNSSHSPISPNACPEGPTPNSVTVSSLPSTQRDVSQALKTSFDDVSNIQQATVSSDKVSEVLLPSSKSGNPPDQRTLKVRIKVGAERVAQYNAEIYNLGLTSPSSSEGNSPDESDGLLIESHEIPSDSPANILKIMTSFPVSGGLLLSPLCEDLLKLARETEYPSESKREPALKNPATYIRLLNNIGKKPKIVHKSGNIQKSEADVSANHHNCKQKTLGGENIECTVQPFHELNCKPLPDSVSETDTDVQVKRRKGNKGRVEERSVFGNSVKDTFLEPYAQRESRWSSLEKVGENRATIYQKDASVDHVQSRKNLVKLNHAPSEAYSDKSDGEAVKRTMSNLSLKAGPIGTSSTEQNVSGLSNAVYRLPVECEKRAQGSVSTRKLVPKADGCPTAEDKYSGKKDTVRRLHLSKKEVVHTSLEHVENPKPNNINLDAVKGKTCSADKLKERSSSKKCSDKVSYDTLLAEPSTAAIHSREGTVDWLQQTVAPTVLIEENWVACDRCEKWRLLPYGTKSEDLPDKWVCSMLDWLPGMNNCNISEDETTKALHASYPENRHNSQAHSDGTMAGVISSDTRHFNLNHTNRSSDQMKQPKLKEKRNTVSMTDPVPANAEMQLQRLAAKNESSKVVKQSLSGVNVSNSLDMQHPNRSTVVSEKTNKRKGEHVVGDEANMRKKIKIEPTQHVNGKVKTINSKDDALTVDNFRTSSGHLGGMNGHNSKSTFPNKAVMKDGKKRSEQKKAISGGDFQISLKKRTGQMQSGFPDNRSSDMKTCNSREAATKKIKLKNFAYSPHQVETRKISESNLQERKTFIKEESKVGDYHVDIKSLVSQGDTSKRKSDEARVHSSGSKEYPSNRSVEKEQQVRKPKPKMKLTIEDIDKLRQDLGCEQPSTAATSSSSKVSGSRKNRITHMKVKGSPGESVCSSPVRMLYSNHASPVVEETLGKVESKEIRGMNESSELAIIARKGMSCLTNDNGSEILEPRNKLEEETDFNNHIAQRHEVSSNGSRLKSLKKATSVGKKDFGKLGDKNDVKSSQDSPKRTVGQIFAKKESWNGKLHIDLRQGDKQGAFGRKKQASGLSRSVKRSYMDSRPLDASLVDNTPRDLKETANACSQNVTGNFFSNEAAQSLPMEANLGNKNGYAVTKSTALKEAEVALIEAEELRVHADLIKNSGFSSESSYEYFKAALKFLRGASLLEACSAESNKHLETSPMQMYSTTAQICKTCASEYEKSHELAAAALAYKCMEVAYLRVVYCKSANTSRVWHELQSHLQMVPQGESPSSSSSDVDNLNNLVMMEKSSLSKSGGSHPGSHVIVPRIHLNFVRLLDFAKDVNAAMEAAKKSQDTFAAARLGLEQSQNKDAIVSVKRVMDFSFQDVEELVRLVSLAFNTVNHQGLSGRRE